MSSPPADPTNPQSPSRQYRIYGVLGRGGFGTVYRAEFLGLGGFTKPVALKVLNPEIASMEQVAERLRDEARLLALLNHRAIVKADGLVMLAGQWTVVMERVDGVDLKRVLQDQGPLPLGIALEIAQEVASALYAAYDRPASEGQPLRVLHRDIKPSNIHVTPSGVVKVLDFGVARGEFGSREAKTQNYIFGSQGYMAPERVNGFDSHASDIYSLAVVLYEMLTGAAMGPGPIHANAHAAHVEEVVSHVTRRHPDPRLKALLQRSLTWDPYRRLPAREMERALRRMRASHSQPWIEDWADAIIPRLQTQSAEKQGPLSGRVLSEQDPSPAGARPFAAMSQARRAWNTAAGAGPTPFSMLPSDANADTRLLRPQPPQESPRSPPSLEAPGSPAATPPSPFDTVEPRSPFFLSEPAPDPKPEPLEQPAPPPAASPATGTRPAPAQMEVLESRLPQVPSSPSLPSRETAALDPDSLGELLADPEAPASPAAQQNEACDDTETEMDASFSEECSDPPPPLPDLTSLLPRDKTDELPVARLTSAPAFESRPEPTGTDDDEDDTLANDLVAATTWERIEASLPWDAAPAPVRAPAEEPSLDLAEHEPRARWLLFIPAILLGMAISVGIGIAALSSHTTTPPVVLSPDPPPEDPVATNPNGVVEPTPPPTPDIQPGPVVDIPAPDDNTPGPDGDGETPTPRPAEPVHPIRVKPATGNVVITGAQSGNLTGDRTDTSISTSPKALPPGNYKYTIPSNGASPLCFGDVTVMAGRTTIIAYKSAFGVCGVTTE